MAIFIALMAASVVLLPMTLAVLAVIGLIIGLILVDALGNRILFKMSIRNVIRRPSTTALVLGGLMIGTAIISASLVVGDTLDNMIDGEVSRSFGDKDFAVGGPGAGANQTNLYEIGEVGGVRETVLDIDHVRAAEWVLETTFSVLAVQTNLSQPAVNVIGLNDQAVHDFGNFVATDGTLITTSPGTGRAYVNENLADRLGITDGSTIILAKDQFNTQVLTAVTVRDARMAAMNANIFMDLPEAQQLAGDGPAVSSLFVALDQQARTEVDSVRPMLNDTVKSFEGLNLEITADRAESIAEGQSQISMFTSVFFVFSSFSIIAGIALIINIFTMLGEERKGEMGVSRAVGMQRVHLRKLFTYEGLVYAALAAAIGAVAGLLLAYVLIMATGAIIDMGSVDITQYFAFTPFSIALAYLAGFLLTLVTVYLVTFRISKMNIVRAVRNIPEPPRAREDKGLFRLGLLMLAGGALLLLIGILQESLGLSLTGLSMMTLSAGLLLRRFLGDRIAWNIAGLSTLAIWLIDIFPYQADIELFVLSGVFMVTSLLIVVMFNSDSIVLLFTKVLRARGGYKAVVMTAISYPLRAKLRTALSIFIFGLVIFTVTILSMMSGMLSAGIPQLIERSSGGFDIVAFSTAPVDLWGSINSTSDLVDADNVTDMVQLSMGGALVTLNRTDPATNQSQQVSFSYGVIGIEEQFYTVGNYPLKDWDRSRFSNEREVWSAAGADPSLVILDGSAGESTEQMGMAIGESQFAGTMVGDAFQVTTPIGNTSMVTVIGITDQSAFPGIFTNREYVNEDLGVNGTNLFFIRLADGVDAERQATLIQNQFWEVGMLTVALSELAEQAVSQMNGILNLIKAFLALGLIIGITGLGIITIRSIHERRIEIGMMRAIGYTKSMVVANFALESAFVSVLGIVIGTVLGMVVGYQLWENSLSDIGIGFVLPWRSILMVGGLAFLATLLSVYPAARGASKVSPASVLRFE
jgi:putative ABC transport system permease protein